MVRTVIVTKESLNNIKELYLHDAEIKEISCNYFDHKIVIPLVLSLFSQQGTGVLIFKGVVYSEISYHEPWGAGCYILGIIVQNEIEDCTSFFDINGVDEFNSIIRDNHCFKTTIELNSGDRINIVASEMIYNEDIKSID